MFSLKTFERTFLADCPLWDHFGFVREIQQLVCFKNGMGKEFDFTFTDRSPCG